MTGQVFGYSTITEQHPTQWLFHENGTSEIQRRNGTLLGLIRHSFLKLGETIIYEKNCQEFH